MKGLFWISNERCTFKTNSFLLTNIHCLLYKHHLLLEHISDCKDLPHKIRILAILVRKLSSMFLRNKTSYCNYLKATLAVHPFFFFLNLRKHVRTKKNTTSILLVLNLIFISSSWFLAPMDNWTDQAEFFFFLPVGISPSRLTL